MRKGKTSFLLCVFLIFLIFIVAVFFKSKRIDLYGLHILKSTKTVNLAMANVDSLDELYNNIDSFNNAKEINFGNNVLLYDDYTNLCSKYPSIKINASYKYEMYGLILDTNIETLDLSNVTVDNNLLNHLRVFSNLNSIIIDKSNLTLDEKVALKKTYTNIDFKWNITINNKDYASDLEKLDLSNAKITDLDVLYKSLELFSNLKYLDLSDSNLSNETMAKMREDFPDIKIVWRIYFGVWSTKTDVTSFSVLITNFRYVRLKNKDIEVFKYCTDLKALDLGHQAITDISTITTYLPDLEILILADNKIEDISSIEKLTKLKYLELFMNKITDLTPLQYNTNLIDLNISYNNKLSDITPILHLPRLERLWLVHDNISESSYQMLRDAYPNVKLVNTGVGSTGSGWRTHERYYEMIKMYKNVYYYSEAFGKYN